MNPDQTLEAIISVVAQHNIKAATLIISELHDLYHKQTLPLPSDTTTEQHLVALICNACFVFAGYYTHRCPINPLFAIGQIWGLLHGKGYGRLLETESFKHLGGKKHEHD